MWLIRPAISSSAPQEMSCYGWHAQKWGPGPACGGCHESLQGRQGVPPAPPATIVLTGIQVVAFRPGRGQQIVQA